jgi:sulfur-oxidizing protein SoxY
MLSETNVSRRGILTLGLGVVSLGFFGVEANAEDVNKAQDDIIAFTGGKEAAEGGLTLDLPEIAENGNTVPLKVTVVSPMTADAYVKRVLVVADGNPRSGIATFTFSSRSGVAEATTRIRLSKTQNVFAVAELSDGSFKMAKKAVKVTIGGCGG